MDIALAILFGGSMTNMSMDQSSDTAPISTPPDAALSGSINDLLAAAVAASFPVCRPSSGLRSRIFDQIDNQPAIVTTDRAGRIIGFNNAFTRLCGYTLEEVKGRKPGEFLQGDLTDPADAQAIRTAVANGTAIVQDMVNYHKNGSPYRVRIRITPLLDANDNLTGFTAVECKLGDVEAIAA